MNRILTFALLVACCGGLAGADEPAPIDSGSLVGQVTGSATPLSYSKVYVYHLSEQNLSKVVTDPDGNFRFDKLPAGLYKVIAFVLLTPLMTCTFRILLFASGAPVLAKFPFISTTA